MWGVGGWSGWVKTDSIFKDALQCQGPYHNGGLPRKCKSDNQLRGRGLGGLRMITGFSGMGSRGEGYRGVRFRQFRQFRAMCSWHGLPLRFNMYRAHCSMPGTSAN